MRWDAVYIHDDNEDRSGLDDIEARSCAVNRRSEAPGSGREVELIEEREDPSGPGDTGLLEPPSKDLTLES